MNQRTYGRLLFKAIVLSFFWFPVVAIIVFSTNGEDTEDVTAFGYIFAPSVVWVVQVAFIVVLARMRLSAHERLEWEIYRTKHPAPLTGAEVRRISFWSLGGAILALLISPFMIGWLLIFFVIFFLGISTGMLVVRRFRTREH